MLERGDRVADRGRVGRVGVDQHARVLAAIDRAVEVRRHLDDENQIAAREPVVRLLLGAQHAEVVIAGIVQRGGDGAGVFGILDRQQPGRQMLGIGVDRVAEQEQLHDRNRG